MPLMRRGGGPGIATFLLLYQILQVGLENIPPVTLGCIAAMSAIFYKPDALVDILRIPSLEHSCISVVSVWHYGDWKRLLLAGFYHVTEWHLYYNMTSLLWKGMKLEPIVGSKYFLSLVAVFSILCNVVLLVLSVAMDTVFDHSSFMLDCTAGFSGVLFALKVVLSYLMPTATHYVMGIPVSSRMACWAELLLIQVMVPNASFLGHLAGILVGLAYVFGPIKDILDWLWSIEIIINTAIPKKSSFLQDRALTTEHQEMETGGFGDRITAMITQHMKKAIIQTIDHQPASQGDHPTPMPVVPQDMLETPSTIEVQCMTPEDCNSPIIPQDTPKTPSPITARCSIQADCTSLSVEVKNCCENLQAPSSCSSRMSLASIWSKTTQKYSDSDEDDLADDLEDDLELSSEMEVRSKG